MKRALIIVTMSLLFGSASLAAAEDQGVLVWSWVSHGRPGKVESRRCWGSRAEMLRDMEQAARREGGYDIQVDNEQGSVTFKLGPPDHPRMSVFHLLCLPDTIDPRERNE